MAFLQELIKDEAIQIRNGLVLGILGLLFASCGFFFYATSLLGFSLIFLALGLVGGAMVAIAFYVMIRADRLKENWLRELTNVSHSVQYQSQLSGSSDVDDEYYDEEDKDWRDPFEKEDG